VRGDVRDAFTRCFEVADVLVMPAQVGLPPEVGKGEEVSVGLANDLMTCGVSLAGMPAIVVPVKGGQGIGVQLVANVGNEGLLLDVAAKLEELDF
jgi:Asp-tRNA(Asn)/Glu-tRNA(Gln) amidotransferase A subunit family amidase